MAPAHVQAKDELLQRLRSELALPAADRRAQEATEIADRLRALWICRNGHPATFASVIAEQAARTKLAKQAQRHAAAAHVDPAGSKRHVR